MTGYFYTFLLWLPAFAFCTSAVCLVVPPLRRHAIAVFFVPVVAGLSLTCAISLPGAPTLLLAMILGRYCLWLAVPIALLAGTWLGILAARAARLRIGVVWSLVILGIGFVCAEFLYMLPDAWLHELNSGGSGGWGSSGRPDLAERLMHAIHRPIVAAICRLPFPLTFWVASGLVTTIQLGSLGLLFVRLRRGANNSRKQ